MNNLQEDDNRNTSLLYRLKSTASIAKAELYESKIYQKLLLGTTVCLLAFEWGPGNEWLIGSVGAETHNNFSPNNTAEILQASLVTGVAAGTASALEQSIIGLSTASSVRAFPNTFKHWDDTKELDSQKKDNKSDAFTGITLGASAVVVEKNFQNPDRKLVDDAIVTLKSASQIGLFNTVLVSGLSISGHVLDNYGQDQLADNIENLAKNPLTYLAIFGLYKAIDYYKHRKKVKKNKS